MSLRSKEKIRKILKISGIVLISTIIIFSSVIISIGTYIEKSHSNFYYIEEKNTINFTYPDDTYLYDKKEVRKKLEKLTGIKCYTYREEYFSLDLKYSAYCVIIRREIVIDESLSYYGYVKSLCHELCHLKYLSAKERYVDYKTFVLLYESNEPGFRNTALWYADIVMRGNPYDEPIIENGKKVPEYNSWHYMYNYLQEVGYGS